MPQHNRHFRHMATHTAAARLIAAASADAAGMSLAAVACLSSSAAAAAPTSSHVAGPAASANAVEDVAMVITITYGILPHRDKLRGMMWEAFTSEEMLDSNVVLDTGVFDFLGWTLTALEFYESMPPLGRGYLLAQQPPTASPAEENAGRPLKDILSDLFQLWPNPEFMEHCVNLCDAVEGLTAQARRATKTYLLLKGIMIIGFVAALFPHTPHMYILFMAASAEAVKGLLLIAKTSRGTWIRMFLGGMDHHLYV